MNTVNSQLEIADLIARYFREALTGQEKARLEAWINAADANRRLWKQLNDDALLREQIQAMPEISATGAAWEKLQPQLIFERPRPRMRQRVLKYAAIFTGILLGAGILMYLLNRDGMPTDERPAMAKKAAPQPIMPGRSKARLVLGNGHVIELKDNLEQSFTEADGTCVKSSASVLRYTGVNATNAPVYNILETPRGGEFSVVLPDSSIVWLNASSSLRFPTRFHGSTRRVELSGEAYFEIAKNKSKPFIVSINNVSVTVTGTKFNVKAYPDESYVNTTLVEGGVEMRAAGADNNKPVALRPGYQGVWQNRQITVRAAHLEEALAWKNGLFVFRSESLGSIMRKLSRWYDVDVTFPDAATTNLRFTGVIRKYESIQKVLDMLELTQRVEFTINKKNISVMKNKH
jgi:ferric-dicitrate binding protein FerR (iron transport regulator)